MSAEMLSRFEEIAGSDRYGGSLKALAGEALAELRRLHELHLERTKAQRDAARAEIDEWSDLAVRWSVEAHRLRDALIELVACRSLKEELELDAGLGNGNGAAAAEYARRKPLAWAAAREVLLPPQPPKVTLLEPASPAFVVRFDDAWDARYAPPPGSEIVWVHAVVDRSRGRLTINVRPKR